MNDYNESYPQSYDNEEDDSRLYENKSAGSFSPDLALNVANSVVSKLSDARTTLADIDKEIRLMSFQFDSYIANLEFQLQKYQTTAPIVREQLNNIDRKMDKILDCVLDINTDDERKLDYKIKLLETLDNYSDKLSLMMAKLL